MRESKLLFPPQAYPGQELAEHLLETAKIAEKVVDENRLHLVLHHRLKVASKYSAEKPQTEPEEIKRVYRITALLHDIAKAATIYQKSDQQNRSYIYHEIPSALITQNYLEIQGIDHELATLASIAVLLHMSALRTPLDRKIVHELKRRFKEGWNLAPYKEYLEEKLGLESLPEKIEIKEIIDYLQFIDKYLRSRNRNHQKLYVLILAPIIVGDNLSASRARGGVFTGWRRMFMEELLKVLGEKYVKDKNL